MDGAEILKALGETTRLRIFFMLLQSEMCVCELETILDISQSNISRHLQKLKSAGIVDWYRDGQWIHYLFSEDFSKLYPALAGAILELTDQEELYKRDKERFNTYRQHGFSCRDLKDNRDDVMNRLKQRDGE